MRNFKIQDRRVAKILILYTKGSKPLLLVLKRLTNAKEAPGQGDLPGGKVNPGESCEAGIIREAYEETGLALEKVYHATQYTWRDSEGQTVEEHLFYAVIDTIHVVINPREHETYTWLPFDELAQGGLHPELQRIIHTIPWITPFSESDLEDILKLFQETVRTINAADYSPEQIAAWAPEKLDRERWLGILSKNIAFVARINEDIVGFGDATVDGIINHLYTHKDYQGQGIGRVLLHALEQELVKQEVHEFSTEASITARPFFEKRGYIVIKSQDMIHRTGVVFRNYVMTKKLGS